MKLFPLSLLTEALDLAELGEDVVRAEYSGRGMFGEDCFGLILAQDELVRFWMSLGKAIAAVNDSSDWDEMAVDIATAMRTDNMGLSMIYYFPGWKIDNQA